MGSRLKTDESHDDGEYEVPAEGGLRGDQQDKEHQGDNGDTAE